MRLSAMLLAHVGVVAASLAGLTSPVHAQSWQDREVERLSWPELQRFENDSAFRAYLRDVRRMQRRSRAELHPGDEIVVAQADITLECPPDQDCPALEEYLDDLPQTIVVTGSFAAPATPSITNNQVGSVDEGDIVKRIGDYLLVLQDGRIFAMNWRTFALTDRIDVYTLDEHGEPLGADWYDEMLVEGDNIIITAYSYEQEASEISVFRLDRETGRIDRRGVFLISSDDYYDVDNYATRVAGDKLVIYTPYEPEQLASRRGRPALRRWVPEADFDEDRGSPLLDASDIFRPVQGASDPWIHTLSVCPLDRVDTRGLECESTAFVAGEYAEMFVSADNIYLATTPAEDWDIYGLGPCRLSRDEQAQRVPGTVYRLPLSRRGEVDLLSVRGVVNDQFAMNEVDGRFLAVFDWVGDACDDNDAESRHNPELVDATIGSFTDTWRAPHERRFAVLPPLDGRFLENRFAGEWLLYGARDYRARPYDDEDLASLAAPYAYAVHAGRPAEPVALGLSHQVLRLEVVGEDAIVTGYPSRKGLAVSYVDLGETARVTDSLFLEGRYESEGRSHAFNAIAYDSGDGLMGLPTIELETDANRYVWRSRQSQISFLGFDTAGTLTPRGTIGTSAEKGPATGYECELSCVDWYGNSRPIFIEDRVFALMATDIVEATMVDGELTPLRQLDLTQPPPAR